MAYLALVWKDLAIPSWQPVPPCCCWPAHRARDVSIAIHLCRGLSGAPPLRPCCSCCSIRCFICSPCWRNGYARHAFHSPGGFCFSAGPSPVRGADVHCLGARQGNRRSSPIIFFGALLLDRPRSKYAVYYAATFVVLAVWFSCCGAARAISSAMQVTRTTISATLCIRFEPQYA